MDWNINAYDTMLAFQVKINEKIEKPLVFNQNFEKANLILDIGCGNGCFTAEIADRYPDKQIWAIDCDKDLISIAKKKYQRHNITYLNTDYLDFKTEILFDIIITRLVVHIIPDRMEFFHWIYNHLQMDGTLIVIDADDDNFCLFPNLPIFRSLDEQTNEKINNIGQRNTKCTIRSELSNCNFGESRFITFAPNSIIVEKALFLRYMLYVMKIEKGDNIPLEAYKELMDWYDNDNSFIQYGLYLGVYTKKER